MLDLFCGAGGAGTGYARAGFALTGVDIRPQPRYPFLFVQADALEYLAAHGREFDAIHASPPCQMYSKNMRHLSHPQPMLIEATIAALEDTGVPWIVENVDGAPLATSSTLFFGQHGALICGTGLGLRIQRHRLFESSVPLVSTRCQHRDWPLNPHNVLGRARIYEEFGRCDPEKPWREEMGVTWMGRYEAREAIPPAYTEWIGRQLAAHAAPSNVGRAEGHVRGA